MTECSCRTYASCTGSGRRPHALDYPSQPSAQCAVLRSHRLLSGRRRLAQGSSGRVPFPDDVAQNQETGVALSETVRLMQEIDAVIEEHGGWPGAFSGGDGGN